MAVRSYRTNLRCAACVESIRPLFDADPGVVQCAHTVAKFVRRSQRIDAIARVRRVKPIGAVAPVVLQAVRRDARRDILLIEGHHRQQLDMCYAELPEIRNLLNQACERAGVTHSRRRMAREAADVHFVDHDIGKVLRGRRRAD